MLPFAQGEVMWREVDANKPNERAPGFGVRFTGFLHPRSHELVDYLVKNLESGKPLVPPPPPALWPRRMAWGISGAIAIALGALVTTAVLHAVREEPAEEPEVAAAPVDVTPIHVTSPDVTSNDVTPTAVAEVAGPAKPPEEVPQPKPDEVKPPREAEVVPGPKTEIARPLPPRSSRAPTRASRRNGRPS